MLPPVSSLRNKLLLAFLSFICCTGLVVIVSMHFYYKREKLNQIDTRLENIWLQTLEAIKTEQDFYNYELTDTLFFTTGNSDYLSKHQLLLLHTKRDLANLILSNQARELDIESHLRKLDVRLTNYENLFREMVRQARTRGFKDDGLEGNMRTYAHAIENSRHAFDKVQLLTLRRHEKDYIIRKDTSYVQRFEEVCQQMRSELHRSKTADRNLDSLLDNYLQIFRQLVAVEQVMGVSSKSGLRGQIHNQTMGIEALIQAAIYKSKSQVAALQTQFQVTFVVVLAVAVALGIWLSYFLASQIAKPIYKLSAHINQVVDSNFGHQLAPIQAIDENEVAALTENFNFLIEKTHAHLQEIEEKSLILEKQNEELQYMNAKLLASERNLRNLNAVKDRFFFIISHDLRGPLCTINGFLRLFRQYTDTFTLQELREFSGNMDVSVQRVLDLLSNLLEWSSMQSGDLKFQPASVRVADLVRKNLELFAETAKAKEITLRHHVAGDLLVHADQNMLNFIIRNLLSNAIKFTPPQGEVRVWARQTGDYTKITVSDTGIGISQDNLKKLFRENLHHSTPGTAQEKGTGFGLLLCRDFIRKHGGKIGIRSEKERGTAVTFTVPIDKGVIVPKMIAAATVLA